MCRIALAWYESEDARERIRFPQAVQLVNLRDFKFGFDANFSWCFVFKGHELWFHQEEQAIVRRLAAGCTRNCSAPDYSSKRTVYRAVEAAF